MNPWPNTNNERSQFSTTVMPVNEKISSFSLRPHYIRGQPHFGDASSSLQEVVRAMRPDGTIADCCVMYDTGGNHSFVNKADGFYHGNTYPSQSVHFTTIAGSVEGILKLGIIRLIVETAAASHDGIPTTSSVEVAESNELHLSREPDALKELKWPGGGELSHMPPREEMKKMMTVILGNTHTHLFPMPYEAPFGLKQKYPYLAFARSKLSDRIIAYGSIKDKSGYGRGQHSIILEDDQEGSQDQNTDSGNGSQGAGMCSLHGKCPKECCPLMV